MRWKNARWRTVKEKPAEEEMCFRSGGCFEESRNTRLENGVKIAGQEIFRCSEDISCSESKSRTAAENESCEGYDKESQSKR